jgi:hypothetical protein
MKPKKIWANLAVSDLKRTAKFYTDLGFRPNGIHSTTDELTSFLVGNDDFVIHFFLKDILKNGIKGEISDTKQTKLFSLFQQKAKGRLTIGRKRLKKREEKLFRSRKNLVNDITVLYLPILTVTSSMCFICKIKNKRT